jgi:2-keto-4-pentenoate hydratase
VANLSAKQQALTDLLVEARRDVRQLDSLPPDLVPNTTAQAYEINHAVAERLGWEPLGWKIAGTTANMRGKLGLEGPIYGRSFRRFVHLARPVQACRIARPAGRMRVLRYACARPAAAQSRMDDG